MANKQNRFMDGRIPQYQVPGSPTPGNASGAESISASLESRPYGEVPGQTGPQYRYGGVLTYEKPIVEFFGDTVLTGPTDQTFRSGAGIPNNCVGVRFIALAGTVQGSFNGGPLRTILNGDTLSGCEIRSMEIVVAAASAVTFQAVGTGD